MNEPILLRYIADSELYNRADEMQIAAFRQERSRILSKITVTPLLEVQSCVYCGHTLKLRNKHYHVDHFLGITECGIHTLVCTGCGWWMTIEGRIGHFDNGEEWRPSPILYPSALLAFDTASMYVPARILATELTNNSLDFRRMHPTAIERFAQEILSGVYSCEVRHVGRTGDGGIDLLMLQSDSPVVIQVKHRRDSSAIEYISVIREFLGAMVVKNYRKGIFITTAHRYSRGAKRLSVDATKESLAVDSLELVDCRKLVEMTRILSNTNDNTPWMRLSCYQTSCSGGDDECQKVGLW
jgi:restriction system protein